MNKETFELKKAIRDGVAEGIKKGLENMKVPEAELSETKSDMLEWAKEIREYCRSTVGCDGCDFFDKANLCCNLSSTIGPVGWEI